MIVRPDAKHALPEGTHEIPEQEHLETRGHQVHLDVTEHTDPNVIIRYDSEVSTDGGKTWTYGGGFTRQGGPHMDKETGLPATFATATFGHEPTPRHRDHSGRMVGKDPAPRRLVRGRVTVTGGPLTTRLHVAGNRTAHFDQTLVPKS